MLKVISWNMGHWSHRGVANEAWAFLDGVIAPDIALLQESVPPTERRSNNCHWQEIDDTRRWGSAVLTKGLPVSEVQLARNDYPGALVVTDVMLPNERPILAISMYGQLDEYGYAVTTLHRMLSDLTHLLEGKLRKGARPEVILGGDLNASSQWDDKYRTTTHRNVLQRLETLGLVDCQGAFSADRVRTLRHNRSAVPWVIDYIYATKTLAKKVVSHRVVEDPDVVRLSDHNIVEVTFDV